MIKMRAYRAVDEIETCKEYIKGHVKVLLDFGISNITSNNNTWMENPNIYCVIARDDSGEMVGGIRVQVADGVHPLPVEKAVGDIDNNVCKFVRELAINGGVGELSGLWNSRKVKGIGVSLLLVRAGISMINQFNIKMLTGICAGYSLPMFTKVGFVINKDLGSNGEFVYPNENYIARVVGILNIITLETASPIEREKILSLRETPRQRRVEEGPKGELTIEYEMIIPNITKVSLPKEYILGQISQ
jgi:hypothetical protein